MSFTLPGGHDKAVFQVDDRYYMHTENYTGWDIGGAHLKIACLDKNGALCCLDQFATPLWQGIDTLARPVAQALNSLPSAGCVHTLTMTGELADCFPGRREGVIRLLDYVSARLGRANPVYVYAGEKGLVTLAQAAACHADIASANWHASAACVAKYLDTGILVDAGTTTTDIVPFHNHRVCSRGYTDQERLRTGELVYTGIARTPVMAVVARLPWKNLWQDLAAEHFATMADVYRITADLDEDFDMLPAADGGAKTRYDSMKRLARMLGTDYADADMQAWLDAANHIAEKQFEKIERCFAKVRNMHKKITLNRIVAAGAGRFIIRRLAQKQGCELIDFEDLLPSSERASRRINNCATAIAVAALTRMAAVNEQSSGLAICPPAGRPQ